MILFEVRLPVVVYYLLCDMVEYLERSSFLHHTVFVCVHTFSAAVHAAACASLTRDPL